jgi:hypothetical protein
MAKAAMALGLCAGALRRAFRNRWMKNLVERDIWTAGNLKCRDELLACEQVTEPARWPTIRLP